MVYDVIRAGYTDMTPQDAAKEIVQKALQKLQTTSRLIVAIGENHGQNIHQIVQALTLIELKNQGKNPALAVELPDNSLSMLLQNRVGIKAGDTHKYLSHFIAEKEDGLLTAQGIMGYGEENDGMRLLLHTALKHDIPIRFVDAARQFNAAANAPAQKARTKLLDLQDPETKSKAMQTNLFPPAVIAQNRTSIYETRGMYLRNAMMAERSQKLMTETGTDIVILNSGQTHLFGDKNGSNPEDYSLSTQFRRLKEPTLMVSLSHREVSDGRGRPNALHINPTFGSAATMDYQSLVTQSGLSWAEYDPKAIETEYKDILDSECTITVLRMDH